MSAEGPYRDGAAGKLVWSVGEVDSARLGIGAVQKRLQRFTDQGWTVHWVYPNDRYTVIVASRWEAADAPGSADPARERPR